MIISARAKTVKRYKSISKKLYKLKGHTVYSKYYIFSEREIHG